MEILELQEIILTRMVTDTAIRYHLEIQTEDEQGEPKVFHYDDLNHPDLSEMQGFIHLNVRRAEIEHARRLIFKVGASDVIVEK